MNHAMRLLVFVLCSVAGSGLDGGEPVSAGDGGGAERSPVTAASALDRLLAPDSGLASGQTIVFFGDSITEAGGYIRMFRERLSAERPELDITLVNRGHSGYRVPDIRPLLDEEVLSEAPALVVIYIGINDVWHSLHGRGTPKDEYEAGLRDMITRTLESGAKVVLCSPSIIGEMPRGSNPLDAMLDEYAGISERVAEETGAIFCDLRSAFFAYLSEHKTDRSDRGVLTNDGVHMLPAGDRLVIETMAGAMRESLGG
ncbi:MAG: G-D-S-L family lipolytic protein [Planctomycetota bacterium]|nr:MAG: G-D-S-L family lipolytic protein [Planctomycetota bacterium]